MQLTAENSRGLVQISVVYDLDFNDMSSVRSHQDTDNLERIDSDNDSVIEYDMDHGCCLLGLTVYGRERRRLASRDGDSIYLVVDRLPDERYFVSVLMHEIMHLVGTEHTLFDPNALMAARGIASPPTICWHKEDTAAFAKMYDIEPELIGWCSE